MISPHVAHARIPDVERAGWEVLVVGFWVYGNGKPINKHRLKRSYDLVYFMSKKGMREMFTENGRGHYQGGKATGKRNGASVQRSKGKVGRAFGISQSDARYKYNNDYYPANVACEIESLAFGNSGYDLIFAVRQVRSIGDADKNHPTQKPLGLIAQQIKLVSNPRDMILDPFCGSGTTLRAAVNLGRVAIGIDQSEKFCEMAARRMEGPLLDYADRVEGYRQGVLFEDSSA